jgi:transcriptional regulator with AAA-type ATPase domain
VFRIDEIVPADPMHAEVVLHVRRLLRKEVRRKGQNAGNALAFLFGFPRDRHADARWNEAASSNHPFQAGALVAASLREISDGVVELGHDADHVSRCHQFLRERKDQDAVFAKFIATDLATLLELSKARELAVATSLDPDGNERPLPILIRGETGTGKELLAHAIHSITAQVAGRKAPFEVLHVAGMTADMLNDELFGHVRGAFTDAKEARSGRLELADGGTLLIDEVGDLPDAAQLRLLRFLQDQRVSRQGSDETKKLCVRVIAATWRNLDEEVTQHRFRLDLLHRLRAGSDLILPPLRERRNAFEQVVPDLLRLQGHAASPLISRSARDGLELHTWPGNLRELVGVLQQALAFADGDTVRLEHLPAHLQRRYLGIPIHDRALGFFWDELDGQQIDSAHASWRVAQVQRSLDSMEIPPSPAHAQVLKFLTFLDDTSDEHQKIVDATRRAATLAQGYAKRLKIAEYWRHLLTLELPGPVKTAVECQLDAVLTDNQQRQRDLEKVSSELILEQHPWLSMLNDILKSPLLREQRDGVMATFVAGFNLLRVVAPHAVDALRDAYKNGGLAGVRSRIAQAMSDEEDECPPSLAALRDRAPDSLTREDWQELAKLGSTAQIRRFTNYDPKTIKKYLAMYAIVPGSGASKTIDVEATSHGRLNDRK